MERRLAQVARQLDAAPGLAAAEPAEDAPQAPLQLLSAEQMAEFVQKGYVLVRPSEGAGGELPAGFADTFYDRVDELMRDPVHEGARDMGLMTSEVNQLLRTPSCKGALRSLLGESFAIATWGNGTPLLHANATPHSDQGWHKVLRASVLSAPPCSAR